MLGTEEARAGAVLLLERLYWKGRPLPIGRVRLRWLTTRRAVGYWYPGKRPRDVRGESEAA